MPELEEREVRAAGTLCWRRDARGGLSMLVVRNARWDEWGWPKGKLDAGETLAECAVRETREETGVAVALGASLPSTSYVLPDGRPKEVAYWSARVAHEGAATAGADEIGDVAWLPPEQARERIGRDGAPLDRLLELDAAGLLDAPRLIVVRHAKARKRDRWAGAESDRPLTRAGELQAQALVRLLDCWRPNRLLTSPWRRCMQTLEPYAGFSGLKLEHVPGLTETAHRNDPGVVADGIQALLAAGADAAVCTHRPVLESVVASLEASGTDRVTGRLPDGDPWLAPAEILVVHHAQGVPFWAETHRNAPL